MDNDTFEVVSKLKERFLTVAFAESLTGGMISSSIVDIEGASSVFKGSVVSYSDDIKISLLGVPSDVVFNSTAVSRECALYMARGVKKLMNSDIAISVTGIAGPSKGDYKDDIGTTFIGLIVGDEEFCYHYHFEGDRDHIRSEVKKEVMAILNRILC